MAKIELPTQKRKAESYNPKLLVFMGRFKSGKSTAIASLEDNLIIDLEDGYRALDAMVVNANTAYDLFDIKAALEEQMSNTGKKPYRRITIDNATRLEEMSIPYATALYRQTAQGKLFGVIKDSKGMPVLDSKTGKPKFDPNVDVRTLPQGGGCSL